MTTVARLGRRSATPDRPATTRCRGGRRSRPPQGAAPDGCPQRRSSPRRPRCRRPRSTGTRTPATRPVVTVAPFSSSRSLTRAHGPTAAALCCCALREAGRAPTSGRSTPSSDDQPSPSNGRGLPMVSQLNRPFIWHPTLQDLAAGCPITFDVAHDWRCAAPAGRSSPTAASRRPRGCRRGAAGRR